MQPRHGRRGLPHRGAEVLGHRRQPPRRPRQPARGLPESRRQVPQVRAPVVHRGPVIDERTTQRRGGVLALRPGAVELSARAPERPTGRRHDPRIRSYRPAPPQRRGSHRHAPPEWRSPATTGQPPSPGRSPRPPASKHTTQHRACRDAVAVRAPPTVPTPLVNSEPPALDNPWVPPVPPQPYRRYRLHGPRPSRVRCASRDRSGDRMRATGRSQRRRQRREYERRTHRSIAVMTATVSAAPGPAEAGPEWTRSSRVRRPAETGQPTR